MTRRARVWEAFQPRLAVTTAPLTPAECSGPLLHWHASVPPDIPILLSYGTSLPKRWLLGLSAALYGVPLVLSGLGQPWNPQGRGGAKIPAMRRAVQLLLEIVPDRLLIVADAADTIVVNDPRVRMSRLLQSDEQVLVSAECNSWPMCYTRRYESANSEWLKCQQSHSLGEFAACFPNSGCYAGTGKALLTWLAVMHSTTESAHGVEHDDDQAAVHHLLLSGHLPRIRLDSQSSVFLNLFPCPPATAVRADNLSSSSEATPCHQSVRGHLPLEHLRGRGLDLTLYDGSVPRHGALRHPRRPLLVHGNGMHWSLDVLLSQWDAQSNTSSGLPGPKRQVWPPPATLLEHLVLLLDSHSASRGICNVSTLGDLLPGARKMSRAFRPSMRSNPKQSSRVVTRREVN